MITLINNHHVNVLLEEEPKYIHLIWKEGSVEMNEMEYKDTLMQLAAWVKEHSVENWLGDTKNFAFTIVPELQKWTAEKFNARLIENGLKKMALIIPSEFIASLSVQQTVDEMHEQDSATSIDTKYFDDMEQAKKWLLEFNS